MVLLSSVHTAPRGSGAVPLCVRALWRIHWSVCLPSLACDFFRLTPTEGPGTGESLVQFPIRAGDHVVADRGYSTARGIGYVAAAGGQLIVRVNTGALGLRTTQGERFDLLAAVSSLKRAGATKSWTTQVVINDDRAQPARTVPGRVCALRKSAAAIKLAHRKVRQEAARRGKRTQADTLRFAEYVIVFTTFPAASFSAAEILEWYRIRWQVELVFKRFKSLAQLGPPAEIRRRQRQSVAVRQAAGCAPGREADPPCQR